MTLLEKTKNKSFCYCFNDCKKKLYNSRLKSYAMYDGDKDIDIAIELSDLETIVDQIFSIYNYNEPLKDALHNNNLNFVFYSDKICEPIKKLLLNYILGLSIKESTGITCTYDNSLAAFKGSTGFFFNDQDICKIQYLYNNKEEIFIYDESFGSALDWLNKTLYDILTICNSESSNVIIDLPYSALKAPNDNGEHPLKILNIASCLILNEDSPMLPDVLSDIMEHNNIIFIPCFVDREFSEFPSLIDNLYKEPKRSLSYLTDFEKYDFYTRLKPILVNTSDIPYDEYAFDDYDDADFDGEDDFFDDIDESDTQESDSVLEIPKSYPFFSEPIYIPIKNISQNDVPELFCNGIEKHMIDRYTIYFEHLKAISRKIDRLS